MRESGEEGKKFTTANPSVGGEERDKGVSVCAGGEGALKPPARRLLVIVLQISEYDLVRERFDRVRTAIGMIGCGDEEHQ